MSDDDIDYEYGLRDPAWGVQRTGMEGIMIGYQKIHGGTVVRRPRPAKWEEYDVPKDEA